ncbi:PREDICTED: RNA exonuclease 4 isoform X2 [Tarenaya hassleriana]|uniref:RNA exonuclease 4 isoform X2 n=1 Tax=Tarenaya hassleriana TaxID=28532 RepID=UPI00053C256A|nr:PREDICTED: RNA exonuclease 4 isoform X2 [Tarenaya hassleriana]
MEPGSDPPSSQRLRHKCVACYKQFNRKEHLVEHMKIAYHSVHQPRCGVCLKHCKSLESVREHLNGPLAKGNCASIFSERGCSLCLRVFEEASALAEHKHKCRLSAPVPIGTTCIGPWADGSRSHNNCSTSRGPKAVAVDCEMVGGGDDGSIDLCARVCIVDEEENVILDTFVQPQIPVTNYRHEVTGLTKNDLKDGMPFRNVQEKFLSILYDGHYVRRPLLVGHGLKYDLDCLRISYPGHLLRDTAKYQPLMKTNISSQSLKYLTKSYLGYKIQSGKHCPYEDCVSAMRLYKKMRDQDHRFAGKLDTAKPGNGLNLWKQGDLEKMTPEELYEISRSEYWCWCLDRVIEQ